VGEKINFKVGTTNGSGYLALPDSGSGPAVIVIQEWWGLVGHITDVVDRFAHAGFIAFAPDLYHGQAAAEPDTAKKLMMELELDNAGREIINSAHYHCCNSWFLYGRFASNLGRDFGSDN